MRTLGFASLATLFVVAATPVQAQLVLQESFDIPAGTLDGQAGAASFGFVAASVWDSGIYGAPDVAGGSITAPASVASFYSVPGTGNRYYTTNGTVIGRPYSLSGTHFYGSFLTTTSLHSSPASDVLFNFQNFNFRAVNTGSGAFWRMDTFGFINTGVSADGTTLVLWELEFNQVGAADTFRIWFNRNPLTDTPDFANSATNLGANVMGAGGALGLQTNLYLGASNVAIDEIRIGTDWSSVGVAAAPVAVPALPLAGLLLLGSGLLVAGYARSRSQAP